MDLLWIIAFAALCACTVALVWVCARLMQPDAAMRR